MANLPWSSCIKRNKKDASGIASNLPDGGLLYTKNCSSCHQANGEGLKGAFPSLKGSPIVLGDDLDLFVNIIMLGYDARPEYSVMNAVGTDNELTPEEVTAIINHEKQVGVMKQSQYQLKKLRK